MGGKGVALEWEREEAQVPHEWVILEVTTAPSER